LNGWLMSSRLLAEINQAKENINHVIKVTTNYRTKTVIMYTRSMSSVFFGVFRYGV
ncbi:15302_t:CDS:2, partial [Dentiscutata heterogama]